MIKDFEPRLYQQTILNTCTQKNTLVVLPTGLGKTNIFLMLAAHRLKLYPNSKVLLLGPTKPLVLQYLDVFKRHFDFDEHSMGVFTGMVSPEKRAELWKQCRIIFSTPQGLENDIISGRINLEEVSLLGIDEAHRAVGDYAYVFVAQQYCKKAQFPRIIGLTASPGSDIETIKDVCKNLYIEDIEVRTEEDLDVRQYVQQLEMEWVKVELPEPFKIIQRYLHQFLQERLEKLKKWGILHRTDVRHVSKTDLLQLQAQLRSQIASHEQSPVIWQGISVLAEIMKVSHGLELLETQGTIAFYKYMEKLQAESLHSKSKAIKSVVQDTGFKSSWLHIQRLNEQKAEHPKLIELQKIIAKEIRQNPDIKVIVFNQYRDNAVDIVEKLSTIGGIKPRLFVGQTKKGSTGLSQKQQKELLDRFAMGDFNVLVATSIGEEGLDVPAVNLVIFYEPIPSAIRTIQRRGRTARHEKGRVIMLVTRNTRDEGYQWASHHKEKRMYRHLRSLKQNIFGMLEKKEARKEDTKLERFIESKDKIKVIADYREKGSGVLKELINMDAEIHLEKLEHADYMVSSRCCIELKSKEDFVNSIVDGRLLQQLKELKRNYERPVILLQGEEDIYSIRNVNPNAIRGMLATIAVSYGIPVLNSRNEKDTAALIEIIAEREQEEQGKDFSLHGEKRLRSLKDMQEYVVGALPGVGATLSKPLLKHFKTVKNIVNATEEQLKEVEKIGEKKAKMIKDVMEKEYEEL